jgi:hypothetical protein
MNAAHISLTELCLRYFCLPGFSPAESDDQLRRHALSGTYAFFEYALASWTVHLEHTLDTCDLPISLPVSLTQVLETFFRAHWKPARKQTRLTKRIQELTDRIALLEISANIRDSLSSMHCLMTTNLSDLESVHTLDLFSLITRVRAVVEDLAAQPNFASTMQHFYGQQLYKCPRIYCKSFHEGFSTLAQRDSHVERHDRSHLCPVAGCLYATLGYPKAEELARHVKSTHPKGPSEEDFSALTDDGTQANDHTPGPSRRTQKHPATFQCTLCPRRFTRAHNLQSHKRTHTDLRPFVCTVCGKDYARQHDRKRHEDLHSGERKFVCRGSLDSGASWGCGRKFARADALGRHFRSETGHICIKPLQRAWYEEQKQAQAAAGPVTSPPMNQTQVNTTNFLPAALLQQYPALAGLDWNSIHQAQATEEV